MEEVRTQNFTAKDQFNSATALPLKSVVGETINVTAVWVCDRPDLEGNLQTVATLKTDDGRLFGTISDTVVRSVLALPEMLLTEESIAIKPEYRPGTKGREYLIISLA